MPFARGRANSPERLTEYEYCVNPHVWREASPDAVRTWACELLRAIAQWGASSAVISRASRPALATDSHLTRRGRLVIVQCTMILTTTKPINFRLTPSETDARMPTYRATDGC
jgi:hypothetical protein